MKRQSSTIGQRINQFDNLTSATVQSFNELFPDCQIKDTCPLASVEILSPAPNNSRVLLVDGVERVHRMYENFLYNVDRDGYNTEDEDVDDIMGHPV